MSKYLWCEDSAAGYEFWYALCKSLYPDVKVESKGNNTRLRKAASNIQNDGNEYYILIDNAADNPDVIREIRKLSHDTSDKNNVQLMQIHSFEFAVLSFQYLDQWVFAQKDDLKEKRQHLIDKSKLFVKLVSDCGYADELLAFSANNDMFKRHTSEKVAAKLLFEITRNTGFETDKGHLGECFIINCCEWDGRQPDDICGLDGNRISAVQKAEQLVEYSALKKIFEEIAS